MAGRGRGRGKNVSFNVEALGFGRGEALPGPLSQPPPLFPVSNLNHLNASIYMQCWIYSSST